MIVKKCKGCGAIMQETNESLPGFVPEITIKTQYCKRCFRMKNYNELPKIVATNEDYEHVIDSVIKKNGLMIFIVDLFQFKATFNKKMIDKLRGKDVILVANKYDTFPKSTNVTKIVDWLSKECEKIFFGVRAIHIVSSKKGYYIDDLLNTIDFLRRERDVYFVGCANVGKSSLINALLRRNLNYTNDVIATSLIPGTTLNEITIPFFDDNKAFIDTPGLINESDVLNELLPQSYRQILPDGEMKPVTYQITNGNAICLAGLAAVSFETKESVSAIVYTSNKLYIHRCKSERVEDLFANQLGKLLTPPVLEETSKLDYKELTFTFDGKIKKDLWFSGFGFISIKGKCNIKVKVLKNTEVYVTNAIIG